MEHKRSTTVDVDPSNLGPGDSPESAGPLVEKQSFPKMYSRAYTDIAFACFVISVPLVVLSGGLLGIIYSHRSIPLNPRPLDNEESGSSAYLVNYSVTRLVTLASWTSSVAPLLPGFVMTLVSFPTAQRLLEASQADQDQKLRTPYQFGLYLQMLTGGFGAAWQWIKYRTWSSHEKQPAVITHLVLGLSMANLIGFGILAADTWLHVVTSTVIFQQVTRIPSTALESHGRSLYFDPVYSVDCSSRDIYGDPCTVTSYGFQIILNNGVEAYATVNNVSTLSRVSSFIDRGSRYAILLPASTAPDIDFRATTFAVNTQCKPASSFCGLGPGYDDSTPFYCSPGFYGDATGIGYFGNISYRRAASPVGVVLLSQWESDSSQTNRTHGSWDMNPFYIGTWAHARTDTSLRSPSQAPSQLADDPEIITPSSKGMAWVLKCQASVYEVEYTYVNGTITDPQLTLFNASTGGLVAATMNEDFSLPNLEAAINVASLGSSAQNLADRWADSFSQTALGLSSGMMVPTTNLLEQHRTPILVAKVPKAPLFTLIALNLIYAAIGLGLALYALVASDFKRGTGAVRQKLTVSGLVAECFESAERAPKGRNEMENAFAEKERKGFSCRVQIEEADYGGWRPNGRHNNSVNMGCS
ncbi:hypothetical protein MMC29_004935 [Sticta canariensis]|nr:hypothetical protein [Sticta canariensis]